MGSGASLLAQQMKNRLQCRRRKFDPWVRRGPWRREWLPTPSFLPGKTPWANEPGGLLSKGLQRVGHDRATKHTHRDPTILETGPSAGLDTKTLRAPTPRPSSERDGGHTFIWSRQVGTAMRLMLSEEVLMSTLQSRSTRRGRETAGIQLSSALAPASDRAFTTGSSRGCTGARPLVHTASLEGDREMGP